MIIELTLTVKPEGKIPFTGKAEYQIQEVTNRINLLLNQQISGDMKSVIEIDIIKGVCQELANAMPQAGNAVIQQIGNQLMTAVQQLSIPETLPEPMPVNPELIEGGV